MINAEMLHNVDVRFTFSVINFQDLNHSCIQYVLNSNLTFHLLYLVNLIAVIHGQSLHKLFALMLFRVGHQTKKQKSVFILTRSVALFLFFEKNSKNFISGFQNFFENFFSNFQGQKRPELNVVQNSDKLRYGSDIVLG